MRCLFLALAVLSASVVLVSGCKQAEQAEPVRAVVKAQGRALAKEEGRRLRLLLRRSSRPKNLPEKRWN